MSINGPDFIVIGSSRCGTTFIYKYLNQHPSVSMPLIKELHYYGGQRGKSTWNEWTRKHARSLLGEVIRARVSGQALSFTRRYLTGRRNDAWYASLFETKENQISGDITPSYCILPPEQINEIKAAFPETKIIFMMRDPLDRLWSSVKKKFGRRQNTDVSTLSFDVLQAHFNESGVKKLTDYNRIIENWSAVFPKEQLFYGYMDEIIYKPEDFIKRLFTFLGISESPAEDMIFKSVNDTSAHSTTMPEDVSRLLSQRYQEEMKTLFEKTSSPYVENWVRKMEALT